MSDTRPTQPISLISALLVLVTAFGCAKNADSSKPEALIVSARSYMQTFDFNKSRDILLKADSRFPDSGPLRGEYLYLLALSYWHATPPIEREVKEAELLLEKVGREYAQESYAPAAWLYLGRIRDIRDYAGDKPNWEGARDAYKKVVENFPDSQEAGEAAVRLASTYLKQTQTKEQMLKGASMLAEWLAANEQRPEASPVAVELAMLHDTFLPDPAAALRFYQVADRLGFVNPSRTGSYLWRMHTLALDLGEMKNAISYAQRIIVDFGRSGRGYEAQKSLEKLKADHPDLEFRIPTLEIFDLRQEDAT